MTRESAVQLALAPRPIRVRHVDGRRSPILGPVSLLGGSQFGWGEMELIPASHPSAE